MSVAVTSRLLLLLGLAFVLPGAAAAPAPTHLMSKPESAKQIVGAWVPAKEVPGGLFPCEFFANGRLTADGGRTKGTYKVSETGGGTVLVTTVEITLERDGKPLPPEKATIVFTGKGRMVWYPEWAWKGVVLSRKEIAASPH